MTSFGRRRTSALLGAVVLTLAAATLTACGSGSNAQGADDGSVSVVASTDVWGAVAQAVGGDRVRVTSIIDDPSQDPHSFEADSKTLLALSRADVVIENGGGYDDFMKTMVESADSGATVLDAVEISGHTATDGGELNEHVWYDFPTVMAVADQVAAALRDADPDHAADYDQAAQAFEASVQGLVDRETSDAAAVTGRSIAITEPVPLYLTDALGLVDATPVEFSEAVEEGDDVPVAVLKETLDLFGAGRVSALVYNAQTSGPVTEQAEKAATDAGVPVVPATETLPAGMSYLEWMTSNLDAVVSAVEQS